MDTITKIGASIIIAMAVGICINIGSYKGIQKFKYKECVMVDDEFYPKTKAIVYDRDETVNSYYIGTTPDEGIIRYMWVLGKHLTTSQGCVKKDSSPID